MSELVTSLTNFEIITLPLSLYVTENLTIYWPEPEPDDDVPDIAKDIVEQLLCHDPARRLGSAARGGVCVCMYMCCVRIFNILVECYALLANGSVHAKLETCITLQYVLYLSQTYRKIAHSLH